MMMTAPTTAVINKKNMHPTNLLYFKGRALIQQQMTSTPNIHLKPELKNAIPRLHNSFAHGRRFLHWRRALAGPLRCSSVKFLVGKAEVPCTE